MNLNIFAQKLAPYSKAGEQKSVPVGFLSNVRLGTGYYRMIWPQRAISDANACYAFHTLLPYSSLDDLRRMASLKMSYTINETYTEYWKKAASFAEVSGTKLIYDCDDLFFNDLIPDFNAGKEKFVGKDVAIIESLELADEISVSTQYMKEIFLSRIKNKNISVVENMIPQDWIYDDLDITKHIAKYTAAKPVVLWAPSASHIDHSGKLPDDSTHVIDAIIATIDEFDWVMMCGIPPRLVDYIKQGKIKYVKPCDTLSYPKVLKKINPAVIIAPLADNDFNKAKSDIKILEANAMGIPCVAQDLVCYKHNMDKCNFNSGDEMIDQIRAIIKNEPNDPKMQIRRAAASEKFIEAPKNILLHTELMLTPFGALNRRILK